MRVVSMALIDMSYLLISAISIGVAFLTQYWIGFGYVNAVLLLFLLYLAIVRIPLVLNWSSNLYGSVFTRVFFFQVFSIISYAICYNESPALSGKFEDYWDALYFSATTWTTLGYGDINPIGNIRLLSSIQALTGLSTLPVLASVIWLYCERRLWDKSQEEQGKEDYQLTTDSALGHFVEIESEKTKEEQRKRNKIKLNPCNCDNSEPFIEKYFDIIGVLTPLANFIVICKGCGEFSKPKKNAYLAAWAWNRHNKALKRN
ncbi:potassium channel family protein [Thalassotalea sediminis]|uniref:potassium channel family protein n=1 Tax=Thalassotalea sediminis TaxID=1759089 RepID=UPI002572702A|nr:potassium channel family protein [Thalassotalea sediminis]